MTRVRVWMGLLPAAAGLLLFSASARAAECRFDRTLGVGANGSLNASTGSGDIKITPTDGTHVHISGHVKSTGNWFGGDAGDVQRICNQPPIDQNGAEVKVGHVPPDWLRHVSVDYVIEVPRAFAVAVSSGSGNVELHDLSGAVIGTTGSGDMRVSNLRAGAKLETGSGNITAEQMSGNTRLGTGSGDIHARFAQGGDVRASTGSGQIRLENVSGGLTAHTGSGDVEASGRPAGAWQIGTGSGGVRLHVPQGAGFVLDAQANSGDIQSSLPLTLQGSLNKHHVHGTVGNGGPEIHVATSSGDIEID